MWIASGYCHGAAAQATLCLSTSRADCILVYLERLANPRPLCLSTSRADCISNDTQGKMQIIIEYAVSW